MSTRTTYWVYILASRKNGTLYIGVTNSLERRTWQHQHPENSPTSSSFTQRYEVDRLVYFEDYGDIALAIAREKKLKAGSRVKKDRADRKSEPRVARPERRLVRPVAAPMIVIARSVATWRSTRDASWIAASAYGLLAMTES